MKFISRQSNYRVVLAHGQPAEPLTGRIAVPGMYVKFENGIAKVENEKLCEMMMKHPAFKKDFIIAEEGDKDPWNDFRRETEPEHSITNIEYGHVGKSVNPKAKIPLNREGQKVLKEMAKEMAMKMAPELAKELLEKMLKEKQKEKQDEKEEELSSSASINSSLGGPSLKDNDVNVVLDATVSSPINSTTENKEVDKTDDKKID